MDIMTGVGLVSGIVVVAIMVFMGGDLHMFISEHALIIIFGGSIAATMIRFPLGAILHGVPLGAKFAFTMSRLSARELVDELARIAEIARKQGPVGLEKVETDEPFLAKGIRYVADGYDLEFIRDNLERDRDNRSEEHTSELQSRVDLVCRLLLEKKKRKARPHFSLHVRQSSRA